MHIFLFDIDGTLINTGGAGGAALKQAFCDEFGVEEPGQVPFSGRTDRGICGDLFRLNDIEYSDHNWQRLRDGYVQRLPRQLAEREGRVLVGVETLLQKLSELDSAVVGLLTGNLEDGAAIKLTHFGLFHHFSFGGYGDHHADRNLVAKDALTAAHQHLNGRADRITQVWVIGDTPRDIACSRAINARVLAVATGVHSSGELSEHEPDLLLDDLSDTSRILDAVLA